MSGRNIFEAIRIPVLLAVAMWVIIFLIMVGIEAIWFIDEHI